MILTKKYYFLNVLLLLLAIVSFLGWYQFKTNPSTAKTAASIDAFAIGIQGVQFDELGQKQGEMDSPKLLHFARDDSSVLTTPLITLYSKDNKAPWSISSQTGKTFNGTEKVDLIDNVVIHQSPGAQNQDTTITTSLLHIFPNQQLANTDKPVTLVQSGVKITSVGMNAYLDQKHVTLLSQARGFYDPSKAQPIHPVS
ncbi:MAG: lptC [Gammaproteobacteria bacterium]|jgi:lipopolysaccharide export system protein LptC|nr:lptC [Gammaproteobacteria bacterium]